ncbi:hypothetical protein MPTK1_4g11220 [Marchantia polymorpha subsp. ruderalis]|nr:hypothetical protein MARPO_0011s0107 [Marchantia polymorpha]BBN08393.1 hypothetical protein Mp_4g11220 [Marchantia polymorpha subsp. ruderalis]|eukprot:PTQ46429.1 hypothetical protein MARPO_0011s0107 [Marchantia polymorpha]
MADEPLPEMHWWCCECNSTNSSPDHDHLVCHNANCRHYLCPDCFHPKQAGASSSKKTKDTYVYTNSDADYTYTITVKKNNAAPMVADTHFQEHKIKRKRMEALKIANKLFGNYVRKTKLGKMFLSVWSFMHRRKKKTLQIEGQ